MRSNNPKIRTSVTGAISFAERDSVGLAAAAGTLEAERETPTADTVDEDVDGAAEEVDALTADFSRIEETHSLQ